MSQPLYLEWREIKQIAYIVSDLHTAAKHHAALFGSGPYFVVEGFTAAGHTYRNEPWSVNVDAALGQWGHIQIEFIQPNDDRPSIFREVVVPGPFQTRCHHVCLHAADLKKSIADFEAAGHPVVFDFEMFEDTRVVFVDTMASLGHFVELFQSNSKIDYLYEFVRKSAAIPVGHELFRPISDIFDTMPE